jgi:hypothetical protein
MAEQGKFTAATLSGVPQDIPIGETITLFGAVAQLMGFFGGALSFSSQATPLYLFTEGNNESVTLTQLLSGKMEAGGSVFESLLTVFLAKGQRSFHHTFDGSAAFSTGSGAAMGIFETLADTIRFSQSSVISFSIRLGAALGFKDSFLAQWTVRVFEFLALSFRTNTAATQHIAFHNTVAFTDVLKIIFEALVAEDLAFTTTKFPLAQRFSALTEAITQADSSLSTLMAQELIATSILLNDEALRYFGAEITESTALLNTLISSLIGLNALPETIELKAEALGSLVVIGPVTENPDFIAGLAAILRAQSQVSEGVQCFTLQIKLNGEEYIGWVMNTQTSGVTQYDQYPFNSLTRFGNRYLGAGAMGICELSGDTDAGQYIQAQLKTGVTDFGSPMKKRIDRAYLGVTADGQLILKTTTDKGIEDWYQFSPRAGDVHTERVKLGKGVKSRYWQFELSNSEGAHFELESLELVPIILSRRL